MSERDYSKFLREDGRLHVRLIPRPVYVEMVKAYQRREAVIDQVADEQFWLWDLNDRIRKLEEAGGEVSRPDVAQEIMGEMSDSDWWKATAAFEEHLITQFASEPHTWTEYLDPVYDLQEREGWRRRQ